MPFKDKEVEKQYRKAYRANNRDKLVARSNAWGVANPLSPEQRAAKTALQKQRRDADPEGAASRRKASRQKNIEKVNASDASYRENNKEKIAAASRKWHAANKAKKAEDGRKYRKENPDKVNALTAHHRATKSRATPEWADEFIISEAYGLAQLRTKATGIVHHVDHIVPLKGGTVCGLHCEFNLRVIPGKENISKGNRHWPDMP